MSETIHNIKGLDALQKLLDELPANIEKNIVRGGLRAAAKIIRDEARRLCPVSPPSEESVRLYGTVAGELRDSIRVSVRTSRGKVQATIKAGNKKAFYAHMVEFGTARHLIKPANRKSLFFAGVFKASADHPGADKKPFMRPAFAHASTEAIETFATYVRDRLPTEIEKLKSGAHK